MYMAPSRFGAARASYQAIDVTSRVEGASPQQLAGILFEELMKGFDAMLAAGVKRDRAQIASHQARVLSILGGLEGSLDMVRGGEIAQSLSLIYREARRLTLQGGRECDVEPLKRARAMLAEIASAWSEII